MTCKTKTSKPVASSNCASPPTKRAARSSRQTAPISPAPQVSPAKVNKRGRLAVMLLRDEGATIDQIIAELSWLPHTVRAAMTGLKKIGYAIDSDKIDGVRTYRAVATK